jgi:hypothetical protein
MLKTITKPSPGDADAPDLNRHQRKCEICNHPDREAIEEEFVHWHEPWGISYHYKFSKRSLYRHAHATGLIAQRRENTRSILERILEKAADGETKTTGQTVINALRAYTCLTDDGRWIDPPSQVVLSTSRPLAHLPPPHPAEADLHAKAGAIAELPAEVCSSASSVVDFPASSIEPPASRILTRICTSRKIGV